MNWITIDELGYSHSGKTRIWSVRASTGTKQELGRISWHPHWHAYAFYPMQHTIFEKDCLRQIARFCGDRTEECEGARFYVPARVQ